jgi:hypothetical protein
MQTVLLASAALLLLTTPSPLGAQTPDKKQTPNLQNPPEKKSAPSAAKEATASDKKPVPIPPSEIAVLGDYRGELQKDDPEFKEFCERYNGKLVTVGGRVVTARGNELQLLVAWADKKEKMNHVAKITVRANKDGLNDRFVSSVIAPNAPKYGGTATGMFKWDAGKKTLSIEDAILQMTRLQR